VKIPNSRTIGKTLHRVGALFDNCEDHLSNGRYEEAQRAAQAAVNASPGVAYSHFILAEALIASGQGNEALAQLEQVRHLQPDVTLGCMLTARALLSLERFDEALEYAERAAVESPHNADTHDLVFQTHCLSGNAAGARATFDRVMSFFDQGSPEARLCQARLECTCGDLQTARRTISLLLDENPDVATLLVDDVQTDQILAPAIESEEFSSFKGPVGDVRRELEKVLFHNDSNCFFSPRIPEKKMTAAKESYVGLKEGETLLCLFDTTVFHGAKEGIAFTDLGIFFKNYEGKAGFIKYLDLFEPQLIEEKGILGDVGVKIGDTLIAVADDDERRGLARVLAELGRQARSQQSVG
jgi:tetratricopeptide (TPR) repeat protein